MKKTLQFLFIFFFGMFFSQTVLSEYPEGQSAYKDDAEQMFAEMQDFFTRSGLKPCDDNEMYWVTLKIDETGKPILIKKKNDVISAEKNKCAYDLAIKSLGSLRNWQPATKNGKAVSAYFDFPFFPKHFFENYQVHYDITKKIVPPHYHGGISAFSQEVKKNLEAYIDWDTYTPHGKFIVSFVVEKDGNISNIDIEPKVPNSEMFFEDIKFSIKKVKGKWTVAKVFEKEIKYTFKWPLNFDAEGD